MTENEWRIEFVKKVTERMKLIGLNKKELARLANVSEPTMSRYLKGTRTPSILAIINIAKATNQSINELVYFGDFAK